MSCRCRRASGQPLPDTAPGLSTRLRYAVRSPAVLMAAGTGLSRVTGFARTAALAAALGLSLVSDAYNTAAALPTMLLVLVTGGTLSSALVPLLVRPPTDDARRAVGATVLLAVTGVTALATVALAAGSPVIGRLLTSGAPAAVREQRGELVGVLLLLFSPQLMLLGMSVVATALLTAAGRLARVGVTPILTNLVTLAGIGAYVLMVSTPHQASVDPGGAALAVLGLSATLGVGITTAAQLRGCRDLLPPVRTWRHTLHAESLRELLRISRWSLLYVVANQLGLLVVLIVAGRATGVVSAYQWGFAVMQLPYAVVGVTVLSSLYPALARAAAGADFDAVARRASGLLVLLLVPASVLLAGYADVVAAALLGAGAGSGEVHLLAVAVRMFAVGLLPFALFQLLTRMCYARDAPQLPALTNIAVNTVLVGGAALALRGEAPRWLLILLSAGYVASYAVGCIVLLWRARAFTRGVLVPDRAMSRATLGPLLMTAAGALVHVGLDGPVAETAAALLSAAGVAAAVRVGSLRRRSGAPPRPAS